jgi:hypothetical protein
MKQIEHYPEQTNAETQSELGKRGADQRQANRIDRSNRYVATLPHRKLREAGESRKLVYFIEKVFTRTLPKLWNHSSETGSQELLLAIRHFQENPKVFEILAGERGFQEFLNSPYLHNFVTVLQAFGFEIKPPEGMVITANTEAYERKRNRQSRGIAAYNWMSGKSKRH